MKKIALSIIVLLLMPAVVQASSVEKDTCKLRYILTPEASRKPRFNSPSIFGVRPGHPVIFRLPGSGERPMKFTSGNLPEGLTLDESSGAVLGVLSAAGDYKVDFKASNKFGTARGSITFRAGDKIALTPQMGWNSWNCWGLSVTMEKVKSSAMAMIASRLCDYGYSYINIDDAWQGAERTEAGVLPPNELFDNIKDLSSILHSMGLKLGIYSSPGDKTCGGYLGSLGYEGLDAATWNEWGIDYLKYDLCGYRSILKQLDTVTAEDYIKPYLMMSNELAKQPRDIFYSLCEYGRQEVWKWGERVGGNSWRTTGDINDTWARVVNLGSRQKGLASYAGPGHWNDPDMLVVGKVGWGDKTRNTKLTADEQYSHMSLWALLAAPLLIGCDLADMDDFTLALLCNNEVIAVDQDPLGRQADCVFQKDSIEVWMRPLADGSHAVGVFNLGEQPSYINMADLLAKVGCNPQKDVRDLWRQRKIAGRTLNNMKIPSHGVIFVKVK